MTTDEQRELVRDVVEKVEVSCADGGGHQVRIRLRTGAELQRVIPAPQPGDLTRREMSVLWLLGQGLSKERAARQLGIGVTSLGTICGNCRAKLGVHKTRAAIEAARPIIEPNVQWLDLEGREQRAVGHGATWPSPTPEELRVLQALTAGLKGPEIAAQLGKSVNTVYVQMRNLRQQFGAGDNKQLLKFAKEAGLLGAAPGP